jgi:chromate transporter
MAIGLRLAGVLGALAAFVGFTLPSAIVMILFANVVRTTDWVSGSVQHGLKIVAVVIVAQAIWTMARKLLYSVLTYAVALGAVGALLVWHSTAVQLAVIVAAGFVASLVLRRGEAEIPPAVQPLRGKTARTVAIALTLFVLVLLAVPVLAHIVPSTVLSLFDRFYRTGSLVFGGGHVVLPLLERAFVGDGWLSKSEFLAGYGMAQAIPGPLFTFAGYIGAQVAGIAGGVVALVAIFLPSFLLLIGVMPIWSNVQANPKLKAALIGINASVVGILIATFIHPIARTAILSLQDLAVTLVLLAAFMKFKWPAWAIVLIGVALYGLIL